MTNRIFLEITDRVPFADGYEFEGAGAYERLAGRAHFAVNPKVPANSGVCDIDKAPVNDDGLVEFASDIFIYRPVDPTKANKRIFYDYGNRGNQRAIQFFNDAPPSNAPFSLAEAGNGYLFRRGYTFVCCAWQLGNGTRSAQQLKVNYTLSATAKTANLGTVQTVPCRCNRGS